MNLIRIYTYVRSRTRTVFHSVYVNFFFKTTGADEFFILIIDNYASITVYCCKITLNLLDQKTHSYMLRCLQATMPFFACK